MDAWNIEFAKLLKERNNFVPIGAVAGKVLSISPLKIGISGNEIILDSNNSYITEKIKSLMDIGSLAVNDNVLTIGSSNDQTFFIIDRVVI